MERNHILAFVLCFVVIFATQYYVSVTSPPPKPKPAATAGEEGGEGGGAATSTASALGGTSTGTAGLAGLAGLGDAGTGTTTTAAVAPAAGPPPDPTSTSTPALAPSAAPAAPERAVLLENDRLRLVLSSRGAAIHSAVLKGYADYRPSKRALAERPPLDLLDALVEGGRSLGLAVDDLPDLDALPWTVEARPDGRGALFRVAAGALIIEKEVALGDGFVLDVALRFVHRGPKRAKLAYAIEAANAIRREEPKEDEWTFGVAGLKDGAAIKLESAQVKELPWGDGRAEKGGLLGGCGGGSGGPSKPKELGGTAFGGVASRYFAITLLPGDGVATPTLILKKREGKLAGATTLATVPVAAYRVSEVALDPGKVVEHAFRLFIGPKADSVVEPLEDRGLDKLIDLSSFVPLAETLSLLFLAFLGKLHGVIGSYGVAIIILTLLVRGVLHPLSAKSQRSAHRMQKLAPKIKEIQKRYEGKRSAEQMRKMQMEQAELFKKHGVSPVAGCLPLFLQLPVFIALYNALAQSFELRQRGFLWISDLSKPDRTLDLGFSLPWPIEGYLNVLPLCMAVVMFVQQSMTPKATDPQQEQQQKMMKMITVIFPVLFYTVPSGLVLYFLVSSLVGLAETRMIKRQLAREDEGPSAPAAPAVARA